MIVAPIISIIKRIAAILVRTPISISFLRATYGTKKVWQSSLSLPHAQGEAMFGRSFERIEVSCLRKWFLHVFQQDSNIERGMVIGFS
jgi:hypothetical protein